MRSAIDDELATPCATRSAAEAALLGYQRPVDLVLVQRAADQQAQLQHLVDKVEALKSQRRWLWGGIAATGGLALILLFRRKPKPPAQPLATRSA
jgi:uncharacterized protein involved in exopolysaccharide biosynthesis